MMCPSVASALRWPSDRPRAAKQPEMHFRYPGCKEFCWLVRPTQMRVQIQRWREHQKDTLIGFFNIELSGQGLVIKGLALHQKAEEFFLSWPRSRNEASDGRVPSVVGFSSDRFRKLWESSIIAELKKDGYISTETD
jgi:hypothetical protein